MNKRVLISGGAGFIGSHLCDFFIKKGYNVICLDNFTTATINNISHLTGNKNFSLLRHNILSPIRIKGQIDYILHFAALAGPDLFKNRPIDTAITIVSGTLNALDLAREKKARFVLASSDAVYGESTYRSQKESDRGSVDPVARRSVYDEAKRFSETLTMAYFREYKVNTAIARIFQAYGDRMPKDGRVISSFVEKALKGKPVVILGKGKQARSFCHISDLLEGIYKLTKSKLHCPVNIGNPKEISILQLARLVIKIIDSKSKIVFKNALLEDRSFRKPDITLAKSRLKWEPRVGLQEGLKIFINNLEQRGKI